VAIFALLFSFSSLEAVKNCDSDGDGFLSSARKCGGTDCDDSRVDVFPGAPEACDGVDNDCDGLVDEDLPGCGSGGIRWNCKSGIFLDPPDTEPLDCSFDPQYPGYGCPGGRADSWMNGDPDDYMDVNCLATLALGAGGGEPRVELSCMVSSEYAGTITPYVPAGQDWTCDTRDDPFMIRLGTQFQVEDSPNPVFIVGVERARLASKSPDRLFEVALDPYEIEWIQIREPDPTTGELVPVPFTLPIRCNHPFFCFQGNGCKDLLAIWGSFSHSEILCTPEPE
jgi:hypothetical protein